MARGDLNPGTQIAVAVVDDIDENRWGMERSLERFPGVHIAFSADFSAAKAHEDWNEIDWLLIDVADEKEAVDRVPSVDVIRHVKPNPLLRRPRVIAVTSNPIAWSEPLIARRLIEAGADYFLWRKDLSERFAAVISATDPSPERILATLRDWELPQPTEAPEVRELGVTRVSSANEAADAACDDELIREFVARKRKSTKSGTRVDRELYASRHNVARRGKLQARTREGLPPRSGLQAIPGIAQIREFLERAWLWRTPDRSDD